MAIMVTPIGSARCSCSENIVRHNQVCRSLAGHRSLPVEAGDIDHLHLATCKGVCNFLLSEILGALPSKSCGLSSCARVQSCESLASSWLFRATSDGPLVVSRPGSASNSSFRVIGAKHKRQAVAADLTATSRKASVVASSILPRNFQVHEGKGPEEDQLCVAGKSFLIKISFVNVFVPQTGCSDAWEDSQRCWLDVARACSNSWNAPGLLHCQPSWLHA